MTQATRDSIFENITGLCQRIDEMMGGDDYGSEAHDGTIRAFLWKIRQGAHRLDNKPLLDTMLYLMDMEKRVSDFHDTLQDTVLEHF